MLQQNQSQTWWHWLYTNAPAAWTSAIVAVVTLLLVLRTRRRPRRIVIREVSRSSLIGIWPNVRKSIRITFGGEPINTLGQIDVEIFNEGSDFIDQLTLNLILPTETRILGTHTDPEEANAQCQVDKNRLSVRLPHLNPYHEHRQILSLSVLIDGPTNPLKIRGGGQGWSLRYQPLPTQKQERRSQWVRMVMYLAFAASALFYLRWVNKRFAIDPLEVSWRAFYLDLPVLIVSFVLMGLEFWNTKRKLKRPLNSWTDY